MATETHTETGVAAEHGGKGDFPPFDPSTFSSQLLWLAIIFGLFYYLMAKVALPRISGILEVRSDRIAQDLSEANRMKQESDEALAAYEQELAEAKANAHRIAQEARDKAKSETAAERKKIEAGLAAKLADAESHIAGIKANALKEVGSIAGDTASMLVSELTGLKIKKADIDNAVGAASDRG